MSRQLNKIVVRILQFQSCLIVFGTFYFLIYAPNAHSTTTGNSRAITWDLYALWALARYFTILTLHHNTHPSIRRLAMMRASEQSPIDNAFCHDTAVFLVLMTPFPDVMLASWYIWILGGFTHTNDIIDATFTWLMVVCQIVLFTCGCIFARQNGVAPLHILAAPPSPSSVNQRSISDVSQSNEAWSMSSVSARSNTILSHVSVSANSRTASSSLELDTVVREGIQVEDVLDVIDVR